MQIQKGKRNPEYQILKYNEGNEQKIAGDDKCKADVLAEFFSSVFTLEPDGEVPVMDDVPTRFPCVDRLFNQEEIIKLLRALEPSKSPGPDELHPQTLKTPRGDLT